MNKHANKQANKQTSEQTNKQTNEPARNDRRRANGDGRGQTEGQTQPHHWDLLPWAVSALGLTSVGWSRGSGLSALSAPSSAAQRAHLRRQR
jgi:hypothetical protein